VIFLPLYVEVTINVDQGLPLYPFAHPSDQ
jgi:hypothetical protein